MPLEKSRSKKAFKRNVEAEVNAGKPVKQAVAIAYSEKRSAHDSAYAGDCASELMSGRHVSGRKRTQAKQ